MDLKDELMPKNGIKKKPILYFTSAGIFKGIYGIAVKLLQ